MPQDTLLPEDPHHDGIRLEWEYLPHPDGATWRCKIQRLTRGSYWKTLHVSSWDGVMMDMAGTMASDVYNAFFFGEPRDVVRAAQSIYRLAKQHQALHQL